MGKTSPVFLYFYIYINSFFIIQVFFQCTQKRSRARQATAGQSPSWIDTHRRKAEMV